MSVPTIKQLDKDVVNKIAAGEVIQRPSSALKELLENSLDAGATKIIVTAQDGGLKFLQIQDDGHGIKKEDLPILCHRHTTSKLSQFEDLATISSLGFRGEALASISYVAHLTITTQSADDDSGLSYKVQYQDGEMVAPGPQPCAGVRGTTITVEDMFYNTPGRLQAIKGGNEEYKRMIDVVERYAIQRAGVSFTCKRKGENRPDLYTPKTIKPNDCIAAIKAIHGAELSRNLVELKVAVGWHDGLDSVQGLKDVSADSGVCFKANGYVSSVSYGRKHSVFILFINGRMVECSKLRRSVETAYTSLLPKANKPFVYLNLTLPPRHVDVNVHPTKKSVAFMHQEELVDELCSAIQSSASGSHDTTQLTVNTAHNALNKTQQTLFGVAEEAGQENKKNGDAVPYRPKMLVRSDHTTQTLHAVLGHDNSDDVAVGAPSRRRSKQTKQQRVADQSNAQTFGLSAADQINQAGRAATEAGNLLADDVQDVEMLDDGEGDGEALEAPLDGKSSAILQLRREVSEQCHGGLKEIFKRHVYVGMATDHLALIQHKTVLYILDMTNISSDLMYQLALTQATTHDCIHINDGACIQTLVTIGLKMDIATGQLSSQDGNIEEVADLACQLLKVHAPFLRQMFNIGIDTQKGQLTQLPQLIPGYVPRLEYLPMFLARLAADVEWDQEVECARGVADALARLYQARPAPQIQKFKAAQKILLNTQQQAAGSAGHMSLPSLFPSEPLDENKENVSVGTINQLGQEKQVKADKKSGGEGDAQAGVFGLAGQGVGSNNAGDDGVREEYPEYKGQYKAGKDYEYLIQHVILPSIRKHLKPAKLRAKDGTVVEITSFDKLYNMFERC